MADPSPSLFLQDNLVSSRAQDDATLLDPNFINAWGIALRPAGAGGHWWVANTDTSRVTLYVGDSPTVPFGQDGLSVIGVPGAPGAPIAIPIDPPSRDGVPLPAADPTPASVMPPSNPTGQVFSGSATDFLVSGSSLTGVALTDAPARFITVSEDGTIAAWGETGSSPAQRMNAFAVVVDNSATGAIYKGVAVSAETGSGNLLYAANFSQQRIDVFDDEWQQLAPAGFEPDAPGGRDAAEFSPFNVERVFDAGRGEDVLIVAYAKIGDLAAGEEQSTDGFIAKYTLAGEFLDAGDAGGHFNAPWGVALAPAEWGDFDGDLLVGNFGDGRILALDVETLDFEGFLADSYGDPLAVDGLWDLAFGNGASLGASDKLYFSAGPEEESHGLFGSLALFGAAGDIDKADFAVSQEGAGTPRGTVHGGATLPVSALDAIATTPIETGGESHARIENEGTWNAFKNLALDSFDPFWGDSLLLANFVDVRADLSDAGIADLAVTVVGAKRGALATADGDDDIAWYTHSNSNAFLNTATIDAGGGDDSILVSAVARTTLDDDPLADNANPGNGPLWRSGYDGERSFVIVNAGAGDDTIVVEGRASVRAEGGDGDDRLQAGLGHDVLVGGDDDDTFALSRATAAGDQILDFAGASAAGGDVLELAGFGAGATLTHLGGGVWEASGASGDATFSVSSGVGAVTTLTLGEDYLFV